jgi:uncharacterized membrane protein YhaH (DUF805 family)
MNFIDAVKKCIKNYANFNGRARRSEFWWFYLFTVILSIVATVIDTTILNKGVQDIGIVNTTVSLAFLLPSIGAGVRRVHDVGKSGWFILIPIYNIVLFCTNGDAGTNEYGADPKGLEMEEDINAIGNN